MGNIEADNQTWNAVLSQGTAVTDKKKHQIIESTIRLIARHGIAAVTFEQVGQSLGTTKANIKYHFKDKDQLIFTATRLVVMNAQAMTARLVEKAQTPDEKLLAIVDGAYDWYQKYPEHFSVWVLFLYYTQMHEPYAQFFIQTRAVGSNRMQFLLRTLNHQTKKELQYLELAERIQNILYGQIMGLIGKSKEVKKNRKQSVELIQLLLKEEGIQWLKKR